MKDKPKEISAEDIRRVMGHLGSIKSERKASASRENWKKAVAAIKAKKEKKE